MSDYAERIDALLTHPLLAQWLGDDYRELEYSTKLVPDSKKVAHPSPHRDRLLLVGDAAGQMQAQGPIIKGMNHAVTAGALAAEAFVDARSMRPSNSLMPAVPTAELTSVLLMPSMMSFSVANRVAR